MARRAHLVRRRRCSKLLCAPKRTRLLVQLDDAHERHLLVANLVIANARYFGGGMKIAPDAKLTDGKFDVVGVGDSAR